MGGGADLSRAVRWRGGRLIVSHGVRMRQWRQSATLAPSVLVGQRGVEALDRMGHGGPVHAEHADAPHRSALRPRRGRRFDHQPEQARGLRHIDPMIREDIIADAMGHHTRWKAIRRRLHDGAASLFGQVPQVLQRSFADGHVAGRRR